ncbi:MAG: fatty acid kinase, partial [Gaiellales bacterium]|nr:fatty acid kinase [Gaiellales bacterium]
MTSAPNAGDALSLVRLAASGAASALALHASRIDDINVYPVPDGDTGANLSQTARSVVDALHANLAPEPSAIARVGARAALLGARGNSGIILSQLVRGLCDRLGGCQRGLDGDDDIVRARPLGSVRERAGDGQDGALDRLAQRGV